MAQQSWPIVVATDLSHRSDRAMHRAFRLAGHFQHPLVIVAAHSPILADAHPDVQPRTHEILSQTTQTLGDSVQYEIQIETGDPASRIIKCADQADAGLIVLGTHRHRALFDGFRETTGQRIARLGQRPVLIARDFSDHDYTNITAACDFTAASAAAIRFACTLSHAPRITPLHALHIPAKGVLGHGHAARARHALPYLDEAKARDARWRAQESLPDCVGPTEFVTGSSLDVLHRRGHGGAMDLLCIGAHRRSTPFPAIFGALAEDLIRTPPCDLLVISPD